jgi:hypothetical protein
MKKLITVISLFFLTLPCFSQQLTGIWTGVLNNDSLTIRKDQSFEIALTEYRNKVTGYTYSTFIVNDTLYYIVKRVKGEINGDICEVKDEDILTHNFPQKPEKGVQVLYTFRRNNTDSTWRLDGEWKTTATKKFYAISGNVKAKEEKDISRSKLYDHLGDLNLQNTLTFVYPTSAPVKKNNLDVSRTETKAPAEQTISAPVISPPKIENKNALVSANTNQPEKTTAQPVAKTETKIPPPQTSSTTTAPSLKTDDKNTVVASGTKQPEKTTAQPVVKSETNITAPQTSSTTTAPSLKTDDKNTVVASGTKQPEKTTAQPVAKTETNITAPQTSSTTPASSQNAGDKNAVAASGIKQTEKTTAQPVAKSETKITSPQTSSATPASSQNAGDKNAVAASGIKQTEKTTAKPLAKTETKVSQNQPVVKPEPNSGNSNGLSVTAIKQPERTDPAISKQEPSSLVTNEPVKPDGVSTQKEDTQNKEEEFVFTELKRKRKLKPASALVDGRETTPSEIIFFKSDSVIISLYDNGEVDGDTVSVIINDEMFIEKQGLKSAAYRKTYYIPPGEDDSLLVVLYADNLGKYPPNTGLLQIKDGDDITYVRFKADLDRNAAIVLRRKYR